MIGAGVRIGAGTTVGAHAVVKGPATIGRDNRIFQFASIGEDPQDKKYRGEPTQLVIGDRNTFREFCTINRGTAQDQGVTRIGDDNWIMAYVHVAHDCVVGNDVIFSNNTTLAGHVHVGDHVICSGFSAVHQFCRLGAHSFLGGFAAVTRDVPPYVMVAGQPTAPHGINSEGLKRRGFTRGAAAEPQGGVPDSLPRAAPACRGPGPACRARGDAARTADPRRLHRQVRTQPDSLTASMPRIAIVAGEISGDRLGAGLIRAVRARRPDVEFAGIAGPAMRAAGCEVWVPSEELAVMGLAEVVRHLPRLRRILRDLEQRPGRRSARPVHRHRRAGLQPAG